GHGDEPSSRSSAGDEVNREALFDAAHNTLPRSGLFDLACGADRKSDHAVQFLRDRLGLLRELDPGEEPASLRCLFEGRVVEKVSGDFEDAALRKVHLLGPRGVVEVDVCSGGKSASAVPLEHISGIVPAGPLDVGSDEEGPPDALLGGDRKSTRLNSSHVKISYAVFCLKKKILTTS